MQIEFVYEADKRREEKSASQTSGAKDDVIRLYDNQLMNNTLRDDVGGRGEMMCK